VKTFENGQGKGYGFITFKKLEEAQKAIEGMHDKPQPEGKPLLVTMGTRQPGEGKGKGKDGGEKGKGTGSKVSKTAALPAGLVGTVPTASAATEGGKKPKKEVPTGSQICVRNLSKDAKEEDLRKQFKGFGKITDVSVKTFENGQGKGYGFITFKKLEEAQKAIEGMHDKPQPEGKPLLVTMGTRQPGEGKGKGKDGGEKGKGKGGKGKGKAKGQQNAAAYQYPYGYYPYSQEQVQNAWAMHLQYYQQALQAQAYYSGFTGGVIPSEAAISAAASSKKESAAAAAVAPASDKEYTGQVKSISNKNGYGFITCSETKAAYGRDVFVDAALLPDIEVKSKVTFTVELSEKGHPRASKVTKIADAED